LNKHKGIEETSTEISGGREFKAERKVHVKALRRKNIKGTLRRARGSGRAFLKQRGRAWQIFERSQP
jgi:hypothetical protein